MRIVIVILDKPEMKPVKIKGTNLVLLLIKPQREAGMMRPISSSLMIVAQITKMEIPLRKEVEVLGD